MEEVQNNPKIEWKQAKELLGWQLAGSPSVLAVQGRTITNSREIADAINVAILNKTNKIQRNIPKTSTDPLVNYAKLMDGKATSFSLQNLTMPQLNKIINEMKPSNSTSLDLVSIKTIKNIYPAIKQQILNLINSTISTTIYPNGLKTSKVLHSSKETNHQKTQIVTEASISFHPLGRFWTSSLASKLMTI